MSIWFGVLRKRVKLTGYIETQAPLHIGIGRALGATGSDLPIMTDLTGRPIIPGSSFKGALRSQVEALIRGLNASGNRSLWSCDVVAEQWCIRNKQDWERDPQFILLKACDVCKLFGGPYVASKVFISDMAATDETWHSSMLQVRDGVAIHRESLTARHRGKFDFEIISPGVRFSMDIVLDNPEDYETGLLMRALDLFNDGFAFLGGQNSRGTGKIKVVVEQSHEVTPEAFLKQQGVTQLTAMNPETYLMALREKISGGKAHR